MKKSNLFHFVLPVVSLAIGFSIGHFFFAKQSEHLTPTPQKVVPLAVASKSIFLPSPFVKLTDPVLIKQMKDGFRNDSPILYSDDGQTPIKGYYIKKADFDSIFKNTTYTGVSFYFGKHPSYIGKPDRVYTLMFMGATENKTGGYTDDPNGGVYDQVDICPKVCGTF